MNPPQVYTCSPSLTVLPPPSPYHPSGSKKKKKKQPENQYEAVVMKKGEVLEPNRTKSKSYLF